MNTKQIDTINITYEDFNHVVHATYKSTVSEYTKSLNQKINTLVKELSHILKQQKHWIQIKNKDVFYEHNTKSLFPNLSTFDAGNCNTFYDYDDETFIRQFEGYQGTLLRKKDVMLAFQEKTEFLKEFFDFQLPNYYTISPTKYCVDASGNIAFHWSGGRTAYSYHIPICHLDTTEISSYSYLVALQLFIQNDLVPIGLSEENEKLLLNLMTLYKKNHALFVLYNENLICNEGEFLKSIQEDKITISINGVVIDFDGIAESLKNEMPIPLYDSIDEIQAKFLTCDTVRADIDAYDDKILTDPNRGHWDLWEEQEKSDLTGELRNSLFARNPLADIKYDGVIGIDFGTKSTVVVFQENTNHTMPMRIGTGKISKEIELTDYENPTALELIDLESFLKDYHAKAGRPNTKWDDLTTSHTAFNSFLHSNSQQYYSYLYELKQWAGDKNRKIMIRDKQGKSTILSAYLQLEEDSFDPIEIYAYYVGLYINNMHNGIYMDYLLSYPIAYEKGIRDKIVESFSRGIKKSLPIAVLDDEEAMKQFRVAIGASEPVAYAICALKEYMFDPTDEEKVYYGVFDFGGGTTDFDFGIYQESTERRYDYIVESFGSGGDQYLGGENLLELLAFEVFKENRETLRERKITFVLPPECQIFLGSEILLSDSQEAKLNMAQLMEILRHLWEQSEGYQERFETSLIKVNLFDTFGLQQMNIELKVDKEHLEAILRARIEKGVKNFFIGLMEAFQLPYNTKFIDKINILLAGNSSKSPILKEVFAEYITKYNQELQGGKPTEQYGEDSYFVLFPPLGTKESDQVQHQRGYQTYKSNIERPTGKTGVAFGLVKSRLGGKIKLVAECGVTREVKFAYYIGYEKKERFKVITDREIIYQEWHEFIDAEEKDFTIYYSKLAESCEGKLNIDYVSRKKCRLDQIYENANIYYRAVAPKVIEYVVASATSIIHDRYLSEIVRIELN